MQAVIMAGGKGTRLSSVIQDIPKPMVQLNGIPLLEHQIKNLKENGIKDIVLVVGHLGQVIIDYFQTGEKFGVSISYYFEEKPLGTAGALWYLKDRLEEQFILLFGDLYVDINFTRFFEYHCAHKALATLYVHPNSHPYDSDIIEMQEDGKVSGWLYKKLPRTKDYKNLVNAGVYVFNRKIIEFIEEDTKTDLEKQVLVPHLESGQIYAYVCTEYVKDIGTPERLIKVEKDLNNGVCRKRNLHNKQKCIFLDRDGTINKYVGFLRKSSEFELEENVAEAIRKINESEYLVIVVSNQPVIARGECSIEELNDIHNKMDVLLGEEGAYIDDLYYCPHHPDSGYEGEVKELKIKCNCRKPEIGMLKKAVTEHNIDLDNSWFIGDTTMDIQTGINAGCHTALVLTGEAGRDGKFQVKSELIGKDLLDCIEQILGKG